MFRPMRRTRQQLPAEEAEKILRNATSGVLGLSGDDGYPYTVPVSHVYADGKIYFHCAKTGHKLDAIRKNEKVSFCVVAQDKVRARERDTLYISVIAFGRAKIIEDEPGLRRISQLIGEKFAGDYPELCQQEIDEAVAAGVLRCVEIDVDHLTGKCAKDLVPAK